MTKHQAPEVTSEDVERVARAIATGCNLDPNAMSPKAKEAGHEIPEWLFFANAAQLAIAAWNTRATQPLSLTVDEGVLEAVAIAIWENDCATYLPVQWENDPDHWRRYARAAINRLQSLSLPVDIDRSGLAQEVE